MEADAPLPLTTLLSQALVAYTIEFDNEAEHRMPHRTTRYNDPGLRGVWLVSMAMWLNCMQYLSDEPMLVSQLEQRARTSTNLDGMRRWGYVELESESGADPQRKPRDLTIRATRRGLDAQEVWRPLAPEIEDRWRKRFGAAEMDRLRAALAAVAAQIAVDLPDCLPILQYALFSGRHEWASRTPGDGPPAAKLPLPVLLARVLLGVALRFEQRSPLSLAVCANLLRVLTTDGVLVKDLPALTGVSKEGLAMAMHPLTQRDLAVVGPPPGGGRFKAVRLTDRGQEAQWRYTDWTQRLDDAAGQRLGAVAVAALRAALEPLVGDPDDSAPSPLMGGLEPYPDNWRADVRPPQTLPHFPMVLHRGGFPDGS
jgi:DNA-binding MarR family transcriptional regulator